MAVAVYPLMAAAGFGMNFLAKSKDDDIPWWDITRDYYIFPPEFTEIIDEILTISDKGLVTQQIISGNSKKLPGLGYHYFYNTSINNLSLNDRYCGYITFEKKEKKIQTGVIPYYRCYVGGIFMDYQSDILFYIVKKIFKTDNNQVRVVSIDTSHNTARTLYLTVKYNRPKSFQKDVVDWIIEKFTKSSNKNIKVILSGMRGTGKSFIARCVKKEYERQFPAHFIKLFSDFDPTTIGVNAKSIILNEAQSTSPVIILIDEIDEVFKDTLKEKHNFDTRTHHTKNKQTFTAMMDAIGDTPNVIMIGTTELSPEKLYEEEKYYSYMRPGRIDKFIKLDRDVNKIEKLDHKQIKNYPTNQPDPISII